MSTKLADRLSVVVPSATLAINARAQELRAKGIDIISFGAGEPDFDTPTNIREAGIAAIEAGRTRYTAVSGIAELRAAIAERSTRERGVAATAANVVVTVGAKGALFNLALALFEPGDEVIIPAPYWVSYPEQVRLVGATPIFVPSTLERGWKLDPADLARALTPKTKAVILCTPSNPTGAAYTPDELSAIAEVLRTHDCWIILDEIYASLVYDGFDQRSLLSVAPDLSPRVVIIDGVSKTYAMTGWRVGWSIAPIPLSKAMEMVQSQGATSTATPAQWAALEALRSPPMEFEQMRSLFQLRRDRLVEGLRNIPGVRCGTPEGAFYAFCDINEWIGRRTPEGTVLTDDTAVAAWLLDKAHVAVVPGAAFGAPGHMRLSYAVSVENIDKALARISDAVALLE
nr:pyridoxal phosphate-dependent aminotransferase [Deltaproteobacteria bacterium]